MNDLKRLKIALVNLEAVDALAGLQHTLEALLKDLDRVDYSADTKVQIAVKTIEDLLEGR